jgi:hypothetical protein
MNDGSGDKVRLFPHRSLLIGIPLLNLLHPLQWSPFMAPLPSQLSRMRIYKMWPHPSPSFVQPESTTTLCLVPSGPPQSPPDNFYNSVEFSPGQRIFYDTRPEHVAMSACLLAASDNYDFTSDWELRDFLLIIDLLAHCRRALYRIGTMQSELHLQETCNLNRTYKRDAIGIAPTRQMRLESHLQDGRPEEENFVKKQVSLPSPSVVTSFPLPHDNPSTQWDSVVKVEGCARVVGISQRIPMYAACLQDPPVMG